MVTNIEQTIERMEKKIKIYKKTHHNVPKETLYADFNDGDFIFYCQEMPAKIFTGKILSEIEKDYATRIRDIYRSKGKFWPYYWGNHGFKEVFYFDYGEKYYELLVPLNGWEKLFKEAYPYCPIDEMKEYLNEGVYEHRNNRLYNKISDNGIIIGLCMLYKQYPQVETLWKANDYFKNMIVEWILNEQDDKYRKAFSKGTSIDTIVGMPNWLWNKLIEENTKIDKWDFFRIWNKQLAQEKGTITTKKGYPVYNGFDDSTLQDILNLNCTDANTLKKIKRILKNTVDEENKPLFSVKSLFNYLERVDMYQAIPSYESIDILSDYVNMCKHLGVKPRMDSDSLKREHDVTARNHLIWMQEKRAELDATKGPRFEARSKVLQTYEYSNESYIATTPKDIKDLINEGVNNHNCVGSYVDRYAAGNSNIFFIRKTETPKRSYITIELTGSCEDYKQAFLASNQRITNPKDWKFINEWLEHNKALNKKSS